MTHVCILVAVLCLLSDARIVGLLQRYECFDDCCASVSTSEITSHVIFHRVWASLQSHSTHVMLLLYIPATHRCLVLRTQHQCHCNRDHAHTASRTFFRGMHNRVALSSTAWTIFFWQNLDWVWEIRKGRVSVCSKKVTEQSRNLQFERRFVLNWQLRQVSLVRDYYRVLLYVDAERICVAVLFMCWNCPVWKSMEMFYSVTLGALWCVRVAYNYIVNDTWMFLRWNATCSAEFRWRTMKTL